MILQIFWGLGTALSLFGLVPLLQKYFPVKLLAATILVAIAFIYVGFALKSASIAAMQQSQASAQERGAIDAYFDVPLLVGLFTMTRQCPKIRKISGRERPLIASQAPRGTCSQSYQGKWGSGISMPRFYFFDTHESPMPDNFWRLAGERLQSEQRQ